MTDREVRSMSRDEAIAVLEVIRADIDDYSYRCIGHGGRECQLAAVDLALADMRAMAALERLTRRDENNHVWICFGGEDDQQTVGIVDHNKDILQFDGETIQEAILAAAAKLGNPAAVKGEKLKE